MDIGSHTDQIQGAVSFINDIRLIIAAAHISHSCQLKAGILILSYDIKDILVIGELPFAKLVYIEHFFGAFIAHFHIIHAGLNISHIQSLNEFVGKIKVIYQTTVTHGGIHYANRFPVT